MTRIMIVRQAKDVTPMPSIVRVSLLAAFLFCLFLLSSLVASPDASAQTSLPDLGDSSTAALPPAEEVKLGRRFMRQVRTRLPLVEDPTLTGYLERLGTKLAITAGVDPESLKFFLIDDPTLNAFAAPGGFIGVHTGLFFSAESESELAAVLAHELAHISQRHLARLIARSKELSMPAMAAVLAGVLIGGQAGAAALTAANAAVTSDSLRYSRNFEREADAIGIRTLSDAKFDPQGMIRFFARMQRWARVQEMDVPEFLRTHPLTLNRIAEAESRVNAMAKTEVVESLDYQLTRAAIRGRFSRRVDQTVREFQSELEQIDQNKNSNKTIALSYGLALALMRATQFTQARGLLATLSEAHPTELRFKLSLTDVDIAAGDTIRALKTLEKLNSDHPNDDLVASHFAEALVKAGQAQKAFGIIEPVVRRHPDIGAYQQLLARAAAESNQPLFAHTALAEYHYTRDELSQAIDQLYSARPFAKDDYYNSARIEARIREFEAERHQFQ